MNTFQERLLQLDRDLLSGNNICSSRGVLNAFPSSLKKLFLMRGLGLIICRQGNFQFESTLISGKRRRNSLYSGRFAFPGASGIRRYGGIYSCLSDPAYTGYYR